MHKDPKYLIIRFGSVPFVDLTGLRILKGIIEEFIKWINLIFLQKRYTIYIVI
ncbi:hypothetical protein [Veillonella atypica]|uniref:hypothetical protein n=1 Tax=Veillonella atypica TaxID=39777 RepID=UPI003AF85575